MLQWARLNTSKSLCHVIALPLESQSNRLLADVLGKFSMTRLNFKAQLPNHSFARFVYYFAGKEMMKDLFVAYN